MRRLVLLLLLSALAACGSPNPPATSPGLATEASIQDRAQVLATVQGFLDALRAQDTAVMAQHVDSLTRLTLIRPARGGGTRVVVLSGAEFIRLVSQPDQPALDEPIRDPVVHVSGDLASVWAEYQVRREGAVTHCGYDAFHLSRRGGRWKFLNIADTYQQTGCGAPWPDGPR